MSSFLKKISAVLSISVQKISNIYLSLRATVRSVAIQYSQYTLSTGLLRIFCKILAMTIIISPAHADVLKLPNVTVMADHSLSLVVSEIARNYSRSRQTIVNTSFLPQKIQQEQISDGEAADILITSKVEWINDLKLQGLIDVHSQTKFAKDRLVLIGNNETSVMSAGVGRFPTFDIIKAGNGEPVFILGNPEFLMEGAYGKDAMRSFGANDDLEPYTLYVKRLDEMFDMVINQQAFGICLYSSVMDRDDMKIIDILPESAHKPIVYNAVVIASDNMNEARKFLEYLKSTEVHKILTKYGFVVD